MSVRFDGHVQGVGFRFTTVELSRGLDLRGYVMNQPDGSVELVAEGPGLALQTLLDRIHAAHIARFITSESVSWSEATGTHDAFGVRYA